MSDYRPVLYVRSLSVECARIKRVIKQSGLIVDVRNVTASLRNHRALKEATGQMRVPCLVLSGTTVHNAEEIEKYLSLRYGVGK